MSAAEKIRKYIERSLRSGELKPGSMLPSYASLGKKVSCSYVTVHSAMYKLQQQGLVKIVHGKGSFVAGEEHLKVCLCFAYEIIDPAVVREKLENFLRDQSLNIDLELLPVNKRNEFDLSREAVICIGGNLPAQEQEATSFASYRNCAELQEEFSLPASVVRRGTFPYGIITSQIGINGELLKKLSMKKEDLTSDFSWWTVFAEKCRKKGIYPASTGRHRSDTTTFTNYRGLLLALAQGDLSLLSGQTPFFHTSAGRTFLQILKETPFYDANTREENISSFFREKAVLDFYIGSWITVQNGSSYRPDVRINDLLLMPYCCGKKRIMPISVLYLNHLVPVSWDDEKRARIWKLLQYLLSRDFQKFFCDHSGLISCRKDIAPESYQWLQKEDHYGFLPQKGDLVVEDHLFSHRHLDAVFSTVIDLYKCGKLEDEFVLQYMDLKKNGVKISFWDQDEKFAENK